MRRHYKAAPASTFKRITMDKTVLSAQDLLEDSIELGIRIIESGFDPTMIIAIWRGGTPVGMALQETLAYCGVESDHIAIRTSYRGQDRYPEMLDQAAEYVWPDPVAIGPGGRIHQRDEDECPVAEPRN